MRTLIAIWLLASSVSFGASNEPPHPKATDQQRATEQRGSDTKPLFVKAASPNTQAERDYETYEKYEKPTNERKITSATIVLAWVTGFLAVFTAGLWLATFLLSREAKRAAARQAGEVQASINQATRAAGAMERLAEAMSANVQLVTRMQENLPKQMRAYVHINIGSAFYQDQNFFFQVMPILENSGFTPARNVCFSIDARILDANIPRTFRFSDPELDIESNTGLSPRQSFIVRSPQVPRIPEGEVIDVLKGERRRLYVWGKITYDDVFEQSHYTNFCYSVYWVPDGQGIRIAGDYHSAHNDAT